MTWSTELNEYFNKLELDGIKLTEGQKRWYAKKKEVLQEEMLREFPSTQEEAFASSQEGYWFPTQLRELYDNGRVTNISYDRNNVVHCSWDLGQSDETCIWFFQFNKQEDILIIDHFQRSDTSLELMVQMLQQKGYVYGTHIFPHDANARELSGNTFAQQARNYNLEFIVLERSGLLDGINLVRATMSKMWFDKVKCKDGLIALGAYKKRWNTQIGGFTSEPVHDFASHAADSLRYLCQGYKKLMQAGNLESEANTLRNYFNFR